MNALEKFLKYCGVKTPDELDNEPTTDGSPNERQTYDNYQKILSKDAEVTIESIKTFLAGQISLIESRWKDLSLSQEKKAELIPYHTVYKTLEQAISAPQDEREQLETMLNQLSNK